MSTKQNCNNNSIGDIDVGTWSRSNAKLVSMRNWVLKLELETTLTLTLNSISNKVQATLLVNYVKVKVMNQSYLHTHRVERPRLCHPHIEPPQTSWLWIHWCSWSEPWLCWQKGWCEHLRGRRKQSKSIK